MVHKVREALALLRRDGWVLVAQEGSHRQFRHPVKPGKVTISGKPSRDIPPEIWNSILKSGGAEVKYSVLIQRGPRSYGASVPDLPGVFAVGKTFDETRELIAGAIDFHLRGLIADGDPIPPASSGLQLIEVSV